MPPARNVDARPDLITDPLQGQRRQPPGFTDGHIRVISRVY
jgi:hypothetical protein